LVKTYEDITKLITATTTRIKSYHQMGIDPQHDETLMDLKKQKDKITRKILKYLEMFPVWREYLVDVPGIGPGLAGKLLLLYYFGFVPVCPHCQTEVEKREIEKDDKKITGFYCPGCDKKLKGEGNLRFKINKKDFPRISSFWHYMGRHVVDGKIPKQKKGVLGDWNPKGKALGFLIIEQFYGKMSENPAKENYSQYKDWILKRIEKKKKTHPDVTEYHRKNMAKNEAIKLFLSHFWTVARTIDGKVVTEPYVGKIMGHDVEAPYYYNPNKKMKLLEI